MRLASHRRRLKLPHDGLGVYGIIFRSMALLIAFLAFVPLAKAELPEPVGYTWEYGITDTDLVDISNTTAKIDTDKKEIRLLDYAPKVAAMWGEELDYIVLAPDGLIHYSFDGSEMVENEIVSVQGLSNPLAAFVSSPYPDVVVADGSEITHYSFTGAEMESNPILSVSGMTDIISVGTRDIDIAFLDKNELKYYAFDGSEITFVPTLSIESNLANPMDFALFQDSYDAVILDEKEVKYFKAGESPVTVLSGLLGPKAIAATSSDNMAIIDDNKVKHYVLEEGELKYSSTLSVVDGLTSPTCVALRPGTYDKLIVDGNEVKYYMWDGNKLIYNGMLSTRVEGLQDIKGYVWSGVAQSKLQEIGRSVEWVRVLAKCETPPKTSVTWFVTADGINWTASGRVINNTGESRLEVTNDNGLTWKYVGDGSNTLNAVEVWTKTNSGKNIGWRAVLETDDRKETPVISAPIVWQAGNCPEKPIIEEITSCYVTSTPEFTWTFFGDGVDDWQLGYETIIVKHGDDPEVLENIILSTSYSIEPDEDIIGTGGKGSFRVPTSTEPDTAGPLWGSDEFEFDIYIRVFNSMGIPSEWSSPTPFCVIAFERPRIQKLVLPGKDWAKQMKEQAGEKGWEPPGPDEPQTHWLIKEGTTKDDLPRTAAGGKVSVLVDSIGPIEKLVPNLKLAHLDSQETGVHLGEEMLIKETNNKRWLFEFWTEANSKKCPSGTLVEAVLQGEINKNTQVNLSDKLSKTTNTKLEMQLPTENNKPYADGIVVTEGSAYEYWFVVLEGRKTQ